MIDRKVKMKRWLVYYKQRQYGAERWIEANAVTDQHPAEFLLYLLRKHEDHESRLMWAIPIDDEETAAGLIGRL